MESFNGSEGNPMKKLPKRVERFKGRTMGLDLHKKFIQACVFDEHGDEIFNDRIASTPEALTELIDRWTAGGVALQVAMEACGCFMWVYDLLITKLPKEQVRVAAPSQLTAIATSKEKDDEGDARCLAYHLYEGRLPEAFVAEGDLRELRITCRELRSRVDGRSDLMRQMKSHLAQLGLKFAAKDWSTVTGRERIRLLVAQMEARGDKRGESIARLWKLINVMNEEVDHWRKEVAKLSKKFPEIAKLDAQLPGVGPLIAAIAWSELGDPRRYKSAKAYAKATGLTPGFRKSGDREVPCKMTRSGSAHMRWALTRAVLSATRCGKGPGLAVKRWVSRMSRRKPKKSAMVAAARKLAEGIWRLMNLGEAFDAARAFGGASATRET
jgi:transposase